MFNPLGTVLNQLENLGVVFILGGNSSPYQIIVKESAKFDTESETDKIFVWVYYVPWLRFNQVF
jgi:hypothetical protein